MNIRKYVIYSATADNNNTPQVGKYDNSRDFIQ